MNLMHAMTAKGMPDPIVFETFVGHLLHSVAIGVLLMGVTLLTGWPIAKEETGPDRTSLADLTLEAGNLIFLCTGIAGVMVLVNNDIARAFAIGAAIALVRFRVRMEKTTASGYFFALITGMACGVNSLEIGWALAVVYSILKISVYFGTRVARRLEPTPVVGLTPMVTVQAPVSAETAPVAAQISKLPTV